jgi:hypothetical protein
MTNTTTKIRYDAVTAGMVIGLTSKALPHTVLSTTRNAANRWDLVLRNADGVEFSRTDLTGHAKVFHLS